MSQKTKNKIELVRGDLDKKRGILTQYIDPSELEKRFGGEKETVNDLILLYGNGEKDTQTMLENQSHHERTLETKADSAEDSLMPPHQSADKQEDSI